MPSQIDNVLIQVRSKLQDKGIKLWLEPYYYDGIGPIETELESLARDFSEELGLSFDHCKIALSELQDGAVSKLNARKEFTETGIATFKVRVVKKLNGGASVLNLQCPLTNMGKELQEQIAKDLNVNGKQIKLISSGKVIQNNSTLMSQGIENNQQLMALVGNENDESNMIYDRVQKSKDDAELILKSRNQSFMTMEDQDGNAVHLPPNERDAILMALALYEKGRSAMKRQHYDEALVLYLEADEQFSSCNSKILESVDNYALLNLDIVWCYLCLKSFTHLPDAQRRLQICNVNFRRSYGENMNRLQALKGTSGESERALIMRLHLLEGVLFFHQNRRNEAHEKLSLAENELKTLKVDEMSLITLMEMGYTTPESRIALRACNGDIEASINFITDRRENKRLARKKGKEEIDMIRKLEKFGDDDWINPRSVTTLVGMGFTKEIAAVALKKSKNNLTVALDLLQNNYDDLVTEIPTNITANESLIEQLLKIGFDPEMSKMALENCFNNTDKAIELLLKMQNDENYTQILESLNAMQNNVQLNTTDGERATAGSEPTPGPSTGINTSNVQELFANVKDKITKELEAKNAYDRFSEDIANEGDEYLDVDLEQEENLLSEYKNYLEQ